MKRGFTLIEIIVSISIVAILGVASFIGVRLINENIKENKLEQIEDKILLAAETYIETNQEVKNKVKDKGAIIPLNVLHNEGLINLDGIIDKNDDDYVIALLGSETPGEECEATYEAGSWKIGSKTIYICTKDNGDGTTSSNLAIIDPSKVNNTNYSKVSNEPYYFKGLYPSNYIKYNGEEYRIIKVDRDDSLTLKIGSGEFGDFVKGGNYSINKGTLEIYELQYNAGNSEGWLGAVGSNNFAVKLDVCYKISSGTGDKKTPFILDDSKC